MPSCSSTHAVPRLHHHQQPAACSIQRPAHRRRHRAHVNTFVTCDSSHTPLTFFRTLSSLSGSTKRSKPNRFFTPTPSAPVRALHESASSSRCCPSTCHQHLLNAAPFPIRIPPNEYTRPVFNSPPVRPANATRHAAVFCRRRVIHGLAQIPQPWPSQRL